MFQVKEHSGYDKANIPAQKLNGDMPSIDLSRGGLKSAFAAFAAKDKSSPEKTPAKFADTAPRTEKEKSAPEQQKSARNQQEQDIEENQNASASQPDEQNTAKEPAKLEKTGFNPPEALAPTVAAGMLSMTHMKAAQPNKASYEDPSHENDADFYNLGKRSNRRIQKEIQEEAENSYSNGTKQSDRLMQDYSQWQQQQLEQRVFNQTFESFYADESKRLALEEKKIEENIAKLNEELKVAEAERDDAAAALEETRAKITENKEEIAATSAAISSTEADITNLENAANKNQQQINAQQAVVNDATEAVDGVKEAAQDEAKKAQEQQQLAQDMVVGTETYTELVQKARTEAEQLSKEIEKAEKNQLKDDNGQSVYQDEKGNFYAMDGDGKKQEYSAEEQQKLQEKLEKEGLVTANALEKMRQDRDQLLNNANVYEEASQWTKLKELEALDSAARSRVAAATYTKVAADLNTDLGKHQERLDELKAEGRNIRQELDEKKDLLKSLKEKLENQEKTGVLLTAEEEKQLKYLTEKEDRVKQIKTELIAERAELEKIKKDTKALDAANEKYKSPEMQARLNSSDPAVSEAARKELLNMLPPDMRPRAIKELEKNTELEKQKLAQTNAPAPATPQAPTADNTTRTNGSATPSGITASTNMGDQFATAAAGTTTPANEPAPTADQEPAYPYTPYKPAASGMHV